MYRDADILPSISCVGEWGTPEELLRRERGLFRALVEESAAAGGEGGGGGGHARKT